MLKWFGGIIAGIVGTILSFYLTDRIYAKIVFDHLPATLSCVTSDGKSGWCTPTMDGANFILYNESKFSKVGCTIKLEKSENSQVLGVSDRFYLKPQEERRVQVSIPAGLRPTIMDGSVDLKARLDCEGIHIEKSAKYAL
jgi:hypothetical protein